MYIYLKSTPQELSNDRSHDDKSWLQQKLDIVLFWKKTVWNGNISGTKNEKILKKSFFERILNKDFIGVYRKSSLQERIFGNIHAKVSGHILGGKEEIW